MRDLIYSINKRNKYNLIPLNESIKDFEKFTNQKVPPNAIKDFFYTGLNNVDFFTSDFLNKYGVKNIFQVDSQKRDLFDEKFFEQGITFALIQSGALGEQPESSLVSETKERIISWLKDNFDIIKKL